MSRRPDPIKLGLANEFAENPQPRLPTIFILDPSIPRLADALRLYREILLADPLTSERLDIAIVTCGNCLQPVTDFRHPEELEIPSFEVGDGRALQEGILLALATLKRRVAVYDQYGIEHYPGWLVALAGTPISRIHWCRQPIHKGEAKRRLCFFPVGLDYLDLGWLQYISKRTALGVSSAKIHALFSWFATAQQALVAEDPGEVVRFPHPRKWALTKTRLAQWKRRLSRQPNLDACLEKISSPTASTTGPTTPADRIANPPRATALSREDRSIAAERSAGRRDRD